MRIVELNDSDGRRVCGVQISANKRPHLNRCFQPIQQPLLSLCVKLYEESVTCQGQFKPFRKILVTSSAGPVRKLTAHGGNRHIAASLGHIKLPALIFQRGFGPAGKPDDVPPQTHFDFGRAAASLSCGYVAGCSSPLESACGDFWRGCE